MNRYLKTLLIDAPITVTTTGLTRALLYDAMYFVGFSVPENAYTDWSYDEQRDYFLICSYAAICGMMTTTFVKPFITEALTESQPSLWLQSFCNPGKLIALGTRQLQQREFAKAQKTFHEFILRYPDHPQLENAQSQLKETRYLWARNILFTQQNYLEARQAFLTLLNTDNYKRDSVIEYLEFCHLQIAKQQIGQVELTEVLQLIAPTLLNPDSSYYDQVLTFALEQVFPNVDDYDLIEAGEALQESDPKQAFIHFLIAAKKADALLAEHIDKQHAQNQHCFYDALFKCGETLIDIAMDEELDAESQIDLTNLAKAYFHHARQAPPMLADKTECTIAAKAETKLKQIYPVGTGISGDQLRDYKTINVLGQRPHDEERYRFTKMMQNLANQK